MSLLTELTVYYVAGAIKISLLTELIVRFAESGPEGPLFQSGGSLAAPITNS
jgi:hypothetical protein